MTEILISFINKNGFKEMDEKLGYIEVREVAYMVEKGIQDAKKVLEKILIQLQKMLALFAWQLARLEHNNKLFMVADSLYDYLPLSVLFGIQTEIGIETR